MADYGNLKAKQIAIRIVIAQCITTLLVTAAFGMSKNFVSIYSALIGGLLVLIPSIAFAYFATRYSSANQAKQFVRTMYLGEAIKIVLTIVLFYIVMNYIPTNHVAVLLSFIITLAAYWIIPFTNLKTVTSK